MCSCDQTSIHVYQPDNSFLSNLFGLSIRPDTHGGFGLCECASNYLFYGAFVGIGMPVAFAFAISALLFDRHRKSAFIVAGLAFLASAGHLARTFKVNLAPFAGTHWEEPFRQAAAAQFAFNLLFFMILPFGLVFAARKSLAVVRSEGSVG